MNTKPPTPPQNRSVWTAKDEATLRELESRRTRIMAENRQRLVDLFSGWAISPEELDYVISNAEALRDALKPFDSRTYNQE